MCQQIFTYERKDTGRTVTFKAKGRKYAFDVAVQRLGLKPSQADLCREIQRVFKPLPKGRSVRPRINVQWPWPW